jgi:hypothetical protein
MSKEISELEKCWVMDENLRIYHATIMKNGQDHSLPSGIIVASVVEMPGPIVVSLGKWHKATSYVGFSTEAEAKAFKKVTKEEARQKHISERFNLNLAK